MSAKSLKRFWISWNQPGDDYRPIYDPKKESEPFDHKYWCSGEAFDGSYFTMCAVVDATSQEKAKTAVRKYWPDHGEWRFCSEHPMDWEPGDRFPCNKKRAKK